MVMIWTTSTAYLQVWFFTEKEVILAEVKWASMYFEETLQISERVKGKNVLAALLELFICEPFCWKI